MSVKYTDIVSAVKLLLHTGFPTYTIYSEEITEGMKRPAFHINLLPETSTNFNKFYRDQLVMVDISYFSDEPVDLQSKAKNLDMAYKLQDIFDMSLSVLDRAIHVDNLTYEITDDKVLHTTFNLSWFNENEVTEKELETHPLINEVHTRETVL